MKIQLPALHAKWLIDPAYVDDGSLLPGKLDYERQDYPFPAEIGCGWFERMTLAQGISIFHGAHRFTPQAAGRLIPLAEFKLEMPQTTFVVQTVHGSSICHRELHPPTEVIYKPGHDFFRHADRLHMTPWIDSTADSDMNCAAIEDSALAGLVGESLTQQLFEQLGLDRPPVVKVLPMPLHVSAPLRACLSPTLTGPLRKIYAQSKVLEYLCALLSHVCSPAALTQMPQASYRKRERIRELHDHLVALDGKLPSLEDLSQRYGMSARWLNDEFAREYGLPIYSFVTERRLSEAHAALISSQVPIKILSQRMGYSHVNHFSNAFKKKFGYPPSALRKDPSMQNK